MQKDGVHLPRIMQRDAAYEAVQRGDIVSLDRLCQFDVNKVYHNGCTLLHVACLVGSFPIIKYLLEKGANVTVKAHGGSTPLHRASSLGKLHIVQYLVEMGASVSERQDNGCSALYYAASNGHVLVIRYLLEQGANLNVTSASKWTPLHAASHNGNFDVVELLVRKGAKLDEMNEQGETPLHRAARFGHLKIVKHLVENGASVDVKSIYHNTPRDIASHYGFVNIAKYLATPVAPIKPLPSQIIPMPPVLEPSPPPSVHWTPTLLDCSADWLLQTGKSLKAACQTFSSAPLRDAVQRYTRAVHIIETASEASQSVHELFPLCTERQTAATHLLDMSTGVEESLHDTLSSLKVSIHEDTPLRIIFEGALEHVTQGVSKLLQTAEMKQLRKAIIEARALLPVSEIEEAIASHEQVQQVVYEAHDLLDEAEFKLRKANRYGRNVVQAQKEHENAQNAVFDAERDRAMILDRIRVAVQSHGHIELASILPQNTILMNHCLAEYQHIRRIANESMHHVSLYQHKGTECVLKEIPYDRTVLHREIEMLQRLDHPCIAPLDGYFEEHGKAYVRQRYLANGRTMRDWLNGDPSEEDKRRVLLQLFQTIAYCHTQSIAHRDLKLENILVADFPILIDFGLARDYQARPAGQTIQPTRVGGTDGYMSPEAQRGERVSFPADIWALGVVVAKVYSDADEQFPNASTASKRLSQPIASLAETMLEVDPSKRPTIHTLLLHPFWRATENASETTGTAERLRLFESARTEQRSASSTKRIVTSRGDAWKTLKECFAGQSPTIAQTHFSISFANEEGLDVGGLTKECFSLAMEQATSILEGEATHMWPNTTASIDEFTALGRFLGFSFCYHRGTAIHLPITLSSFVWKWMHGETLRPSLELIRESHPSRASYLQNAMTKEPQGWQELFPNASAEPAAWSPEQAQSWVEARLQDLLAERTPALNALKSGFEEVVRAFNLWDQAQALLYYEWELVLCGPRTLDPLDILTALHYASNVNDTTQAWFASILRSLSQVELRIFLMHVTGTFCIPNRIEVELEPNHDHLLTSHVCFNSFAIPNTESRQSLYQWFRSSMVHMQSAGFGLA